MQELTYFVENIFLTATVNMLKYVFYSIKFHVNPASSLSESKREKCTVFHN